jgi:hypothetical protein
MFVEDLDPIVAMGIGHKITQNEIKNFVKKQLATDKNWALKALIKIFEFQTRTEQEQEVTHENNHVGFTGTDGKIMTSFAKQYTTRHFLTPKQMALLYKKMPKYWMQIIKISDKQKLELQIRKALAA